MIKTTQRLVRGFTLLELSIALIIGMATGGMVLTLFNQQLMFLNLFRNQNFLVEEAPVIGAYVGKLVGKADRFRLHRNLPEALSGTAPQTGGSPVLLLNFRQPNGDIRVAILSYENLGAGNVLNYYVLPVGFNAGGPAPAPQWSVTRSAAEVAFTVTNGVLSMTLRGPMREQITYSGTMQQ